MAISVAIFLGFLVYGVTSSPVKLQADATSCMNCHTIYPNKINVHLVPHSHDDVGWLKNVDQYFYGSKSNIQSAGVQYIISAALGALKEDKDRRYVQVETAFFWKWWLQQNQKVRDEFIDLVNNGQIEIINAAWAMNDEAATNYQSIIDQFTLGLRTVNETLGKCAIPRVGWQIDPFGHSREQASIFSQLGFNGVFFARIDYRDMALRRSTQNMELIWKGSSSIPNSNIFTHVFPNFYNEPSGFCFDILCGNEVLNDDPSSPDYNIPRRAAQFATVVHAYAKYYRTNNLFITMGGDFQYQGADKNYANMDKLIQGFKNNSEISLIYSTPSCYIKAVNDEVKSKKIELSLKTDDFFPYASDQYTYWTGYFTSRPDAKRFERLSNNILQADKQLASFERVLGQDQSQSLRWLQEAVGILQHHDAITGTAKSAVAKDYARLLTRGIKTAEPAAAAAILNLLKKSGQPDLKLNLQSCLLSNVSICEVTNAKNVVVTVYNPLERNVSHYVRIPVPVGTYRITGPDGEEKSDLLTPISDFAFVKEGTLKPQPKELVFSARDIPPLGVKLYYIERTSTETPEQQPNLQAKLGTATNGFEIDDQTKLLKSVTINGKTLNVKQEILFYYPATTIRNSGAYAFRPQNSITNPLGNVTVTATVGKLVDEVRQVQPGAIQIIRVYKGANDSFIEFDWLAGPIEQLGSIGRELISRFTVDDFNSASTFYTDANGREILKRILNKRYDYTYNASEEPVTSNYYPITSKIVIKDESKKLQLAVLNDRAQGGTSLRNGQIELMIHRRLLRDDGFGVSEALNDFEYGQPIVVRGQHQLVFGPTDNNVAGGHSTSAQERILALKKLLQPVVLLADASSNDNSLDRVKASLNLQFSGLKGKLPENVHILTLEPLKDNTYILRLEHLLEDGEDATLSKPVTVNLKGLFTLFEILELRETSLGANEYLEDFNTRKKYEWPIKGGQTVIGGSAEAIPLAVDPSQIALGPMQIRTFIMKVTKA